MLTLEALTARYAHPGRVEWIGVRPDRKAEMVACDAVDVGETGLSGDHARIGKRSVTLIQAEHLPVIAALSGQEAVTPDVLRRNLVVSGLNLAAFLGQEIRLGSVVLEITGPCAPCSRMEAALGRGGYTAMRGHGGVTARIVMPGRIERGDPVTPLRVA